MSSASVVVLLAAQSNLDLTSLVPKLTFVRSTRGTPVVFTSAFPQMSLARWSTRRALYLNEEMEIFSAAPSVARSPASSSKAHGRTPGTQR